MEEEFINPHLIKDGIPLSDAEIAVKQNFSQFDYQHGSSCYIAKLEELVDGNRLYFKPSKEYGIGSNELCTVRLTPDAEPLIAIFEVSQRGDVYIIPHSKRTTIKLNGEVITNKSLLNNFDQVEIANLKFQFVNFYENMKYHVSTEFNYIRKDEILRELLAKYLIQYKYDPVITPFIRTYLSSDTVEDAIRCCLNEIKELVKTNGNDLFIGFIKQMVSQFFCMSIVDMGATLSAYEIVTYNTLNEVKRTPTRKINFDEMADSEDPFETFRTESKKRQEEQQ